MKKDLVVIDGDEAEYSVHKLVPSVVAKALEVLPESIMEMDEEELRKAVKPTIEHERLRVAFWREYDSAVASRKKVMRMNNVFGGIVSSSTFMRTYIGNSFNLAYMMRPPINYEISMMESLNFGVEQLREILSLPLRDEKGKIDTKLARVKADIVESLLERVKGAVTKRIETKNLNVAVDATPTEKQEALTQKEIDERLALLEKQASGQVIEAEIIDVTEKQT